MAVAKRRSAKVLRRSFRLWWVILLLLVLAASGIYIWFRYRVGQPAEQVSYTNVSVTPAAYDLTLSGPGTLEPSRSVSVSSSVAGTIETIPAVGDIVKKGQVLVTLETTELKQAVSSAQLALEQAASQQASLSLSQSDTAGSLASDIANAQRTVAEDERALNSSEDDLALAKRLEAVGSESGVNVTAAQNAYDSAAAAFQGSQEALATLQASSSLQDEGNAQDLRNAELAVQEAQLAVTSAKRDLEAATIRAPIAGVVTSISDEGSGSDSTTSSTVIQSGTTITQGQTILTLSAYSTIDLIAQIDETQISEVGLQQKATVEVDAVEGQAFSGTVTAISPSATVEDNIPIFEVTVSIDNPDLTLRPGMTAEASIAVETLSDTLTVPTAAVQSRGGATFVEFARDDGVVSVPVEVVGSADLNSVVQVATRPQGIAASGESSDNLAADAASSASAASTAQDGAASSQESPADPADFSALVQSGTPVTVKVPSTSATTATTDEGGFGGPPGGGFGGPPGGGFR